MQILGLSCVFLNSLHDSVFIFIIWIPEQSRLADLPAEVISALFEAFACTSGAYITDGC